MANGSGVSGCEELENGQIWEDSESVRYILRLGWELAGLTLSAGAGEDSMSSMGSAAGSTSSPIRAAGAAEEPSLCAGSVRDSAPCDGLPRDLIPDVETPDISEGGCMEGCGAGVARNCWDGPGRLEGEEFGDGGAGGAIPSLRDEESSLSLSFGVSSDSSSSLLFFGAPSDSSSSSPPFLSSPSLSSLSLWP